MGTQKRDAGEGGQTGVQYTGRQNISFGTLRMEAIATLVVTTGTDIVRGKAHNAQNVRRAER